MFCVMSYGFFLYSLTSSELFMLDLVNISDRKDIYKKNRNMFGIWLEGYIYKLFLRGFLMNLCLFKAKRIRKYIIHPWYSCFLYLEIIINHYLTIWIKEKKKKINQLK